MTPVYIEWHDSRLVELRWLPDGCAQIDLSSLLVYEEKGREHFGVCAWKAVLTLFHASTPNGLQAFASGEWISDGLITGPDGAELELVSVLDERECAAVQITLNSGVVLDVRASAVRLKLVSAIKSLRDWHGPLES